MESSTLKRRVLGVEEKEDVEEKSLVAVIENRAMEVGLAILDRPSAKLYLCQFIETSRNYHTTLMMLQRHPPSSLLIVQDRTPCIAHGLNHATAIHTQVSLLACLEGINQVQVPLPRASFDDSRGELLLELLSMERRRSCQEGATLRKRCYLAVGAAGALLGYFQESEHHTIQPHSLEVDLIGTEKHMELDVKTIECLGLTASSKGQDKISLPSLFKMMNKTKTVCGGRLLKSNLLQPLFHRETLNCRYEAVQELLDEENKQQQLSKALKSLPTDLDKMLSSLTIHHSTSIQNGLQSEVSTCRRIASLVDGVMLMKEVLSSLGSITLLLKDCKSTLLRGICATLESPCFREILEMASSVLEDDVHRQKSSALKRIEQCYAVKSGFDGFLDVARTNFCRITEQIHSFADEYQSVHQLSNIKVSYNAKRGFSFLTNLQSNSLPQGSLVIERKGRNTYHFVTHELIALNSRLKDATHDCMLLTQQALDSVLSKVLDQLEALRKLVDSLALLDVLVSFAELAESSSKGYCRPVISPHGVLVILEGRHPVFDVVSEVDFTPNDTFMTKISTCHIITGPNMSGKSTYLKQVALLLIMAQVGAFVPADDFCFTPRDKILTRMGFADSIETNSSSFMVEMQEMSYILHTMTRESFVIIDELGRSTSTADGVSIAWAVCEKLLEEGVFSFVATHFSDLPFLADLYPTVRLYNLEVKVQESGMEFMWKLRVLSCEEIAETTPRSYGVELAKVSSFPEEILERAMAVSEIVAEHQASLGPSIDTDQCKKVEESFDFYRVTRKLICLCIRTAEMEDNELVEAVRGLQQELF